MIPKSPFEDDFSPAPRQQQPPLRPRRYREESGGRRGRQRHREPLRGRAQPQSPAAIRQGALQRRPAAEGRFGCSGGGRLRSGPPRGAGQGSTRWPREEPPPPPGAPEEGLQRGSEPFVAQARSPNFGRGSTQRKARPRQKEPGSTGPHSPPAAPAAATGGGPQGPGPLSGRSEPAHGVLPASIPAPRHLPAAAAPRGVRGARALGRAAARPGPPGPAQAGGEWRGPPGAAGRGGAPSPGAGPGREQRRGGAGQGGAAGGGAADWWVCGGVACCGGVAPRGGLALAPARAPAAVTSGQAGVTSGGGR